MRVADAVLRVQQGRDHESQETDLRPAPPRGAGPARRGPGTSACREVQIAALHGIGHDIAAETDAIDRVISDFIRKLGKKECRKDKDVIDETPAAYKDIDAVMQAQRDLVDVVHTLKQVVCVKG
jgi:tRNA-splicing ligase RtcB